MKMKKAIVSMIITIAMVMINLLMCSTALAAEPVMVNIPVYKVIDGDTPTADETFSFELEALNGEPMPAGSTNGVRTVSIVGDGNTMFGQIAYTEPGDYCYEISEVQGTNSRYEYDDTVYSLTVQVTWVNETYEDLQAMMYLTEKGGTEKQEYAAFTNTYDAETEYQSVMIDPPVHKRISGDTPSSNSTFTFYLSADSLSYPMPAGSVNGIKWVSVVGAGTEDFGNITYTEPGVYTYKVYERDSEINGYDYDPVVYTMTVTVTATNGVLTAVREIVTDSGYEAVSLTFTNHYTTPETPKTGDDSFLIICWIILGLSALGTAVSFAVKKLQEKKKDENEG